MHGRQVTNLGSHKPERYRTAAPPYGEETVPRSYPGPGGRRPRIEIRMRLCVLAALVGGAAPRDRDGARPAGARLLPPSREDGLHPAGRRPRTVPAPRHARRDTAPSEMHAWSGERGCARQTR